MDFKAINFGRADAHTEGEFFPQLLSEGYLNISSVAEKALSGNVFLFLGYKGSGKSSLSEHLRLQASSTIVDLQQLKSFPFKLFKSLLETEDTLIRYKKLWRWLLCVKVFSDLYSDSSASIQSQESIQKIVAFFTQAGLFPVLQLSSLIKRNITETVKATIKTLELSHTENRESVDVDFELLTDYLLNVIGCFKEETPHILIIDDLDDVLTPNGVQFGIISALINEVNDLNRLFSNSSVPFKILVLCRTDMFERLPDPNKNKIKQDCSFTFSWYREGVDNSQKSDLLNLINLRARLVYPEIEDVLKSFFPVRYHQKSIHTALLDYTRHIPRDFIQLMNYIQDQCEDNMETIPAEVITKGINEYSTEYFKQEIADEMAGYLPRQVIEEVFNVLSSIGKRRFIYSEFLNSCQYREHLKSTDVDSILRILYDCSAIGHRINDSIVSFKYRTRASSFSPKHLIMVHSGLWKALNLTD